MRGWLHPLFSFNVLSGLRSRTELIPFSFLVPRSSVDWQAAELGSFCSCCPQGCFFVFMFSIF